MVKWHCKMCHLWGPTSSPHSNHCMSSCNIDRNRWIMPRLQGVHIVFTHPAWFSMPHGTWDDKEVDCKEMKEWKKDSIISCRWIPKLDDHLEI